MKSLATFILIFLCAQAIAQHLELGLNAGAFSYEVQPNLAPVRPTVQPMASGKVLYYFRHYCLGFDVGYRRIAYQQEMSGGDIGFGLYNISSFKNCLTENNQVPVKIAANRIFTFKSIEIYTGAFVAQMWQSWKIIGAPFSPDLRASGSSTFYFAGIHVGCTRMVSKRLGLNFEAAAERNVLHSYYYVPPDLTVYPISIGVRYKI